jgi:short-subunit dehydrogenase
MSFNNWKDKVVFITGASSGIGEALAIEFAKRGAALGLLARREDVLKDLVAKVESAGGKALALPADVTDASAVKEAAERLKEKFGRIDVLIVNAGIGGTSDTRAMDVDHITKIIKTNLIGAVNSVAAVVPTMLDQQSGHIVAISSLAGYRGLPKSSAYCASKAGMTAFFESVRVDLMGSGVDVSTISPGFIKTSLTSGRANKMPYLMELEDGVKKIMRAIEKRKKFYAFPWQLATLVRVALVFPVSLYDKFISKRNYRE